MSTNKFLVVRFAPGSGGKFLSILLQCSNSVNAWDQELAEAKLNSNPDKIFEYVASKFTSNFANWQHIEPEVPYQTDFVSNRFARGDEISFAQASEFLVNDHLYQQHFDSNKKVCLILNKSQIPLWIQNQSDVVNIIIDNKQSYKWFLRARYAKQFLQSESGAYIIKQEHKAHCSPKRSALAAEFNNESVYRGSWHGFAKKYLLGDPIGNMFKRSEDVVAHDTNSTVNNTFFALSSYLNEEKFVKEFKNLCIKLDINTVPDTLVQKLFRYYHSLHQPHLNKTIFSGTSYGYLKKMLMTKPRIRFGVTHKNYMGYIGDQVPSHELDRFFASTDPVVLVTDNKIAVPTTSNQTVLSIAPEYYGIHHMPFDVFAGSSPTRAYNCFINRICPNRQSWFYKLHDIGLDNGFVSFNIDYRDKPSHTYKEKIDIFDRLHSQYNYIFQEQYEKTRPIVPFCNFQQTSNIEEIIAGSMISLVIETYYGDNRAIALSEKTFRALQLPRPFLLFAPVHTIAYLKHLGFQLIEDVVNHDYDEDTSWIERQSKILCQIQQFVRNPNFEILPHWREIALHNQRLMAKWHTQWENKIPICLARAKQILYNNEHVSNDHSLNLY